MAGAGSGFEVALVQNALGLAFTARNAAGLDERDSHMQSRDLIYAMREPAGKLFHRTHAVAEHLRSDLDADFHLIQPALSRKHDLIVRKIRLGLE